MGIEIMQKPDWITYDDLHELLYAAHEENRRKGLYVRTSTLSGDELKRHIGDDGMCFVALDNNKLVGSSSIKIVDIDRWFYKGRIITVCLSGVLPAYQGQHINTMLDKKINEFALENGFKALVFHTSENNTKRQQIGLHRGYRYVDFISAKKEDHYTVVMLKWLDGCPFSERYCAFRFKLKRFLVRLRYKPGHIKRFGI